MIYSNYKRSRNIIIVHKVYSRCNGGRENKKLLIVRDQTRPTQWTEFCVIYVSSMTDALSLRKVLEIWQQPATSLLEGRWRCFTWIRIAKPRRYAWWLSLYYSKVKTVKCYNMQFFTSKQKQCYLIADDLECYLIVHLHTRKSYDTWHRIFLNFRAVAKSIIQVYNSE